MFKERKIFPDLKAHLSKKYITVITGMRRTGKTTLVKELLNHVNSDNKIYIDLERIDNRLLFNENNYENIVFQLTSKGLNFEKKVYIAIDEIQLVKNIPSVIKYLYDNYDIKFIATGSSSFYLKNLFTESLAGRKKIFELFPLDFGELIGFKDISSAKEDFRKKIFSNIEYQALKNYYEEYIRFGGFPEVVIERNNKDKEELLDDILNSYINQDIKVLSDFNTDSEIFDLIKLFGARVGSRIDYSKLAKICGISRYKIVSYFEFFEKTYLIYRINVRSTSPDREIVKANKLYFCDNGLLMRLSQLSSGAIFENAVFNQLKNFGDIKYYSRKSGKEIDFILNEKTAYEVKESAEERDLNKLSALAGDINIKDSGIIIRYPLKKAKEPGRIIWGGNII